MHVDPTMGDFEEDTSTAMEEDSITQDAMLEAMEIADPPAAIAAYSVTVQAPAEDSGAVKRKETAFHRLAPLYLKNNKTEELMQLVYLVRPFIGQVSKAKGSKLFRSVLDAFLLLTDYTAEKVSIGRQPGVCNLLSIR